MALRSIVATVLCLPAILGGSALHGAQWAADQTDSELSYTAFFEGSPIKGSFARFRVTVSDDDSHTPRNIHVAVDVDSVTMGGGDINAAIRTGEWFDVANFPQAVFTSEAVTAGDGSHYVSSGALQLKGVEQAVTIPFSWQPTGDNSVNMLGSATLMRLQFGIGTGDWASGNEIGLNVEVNFRLTLHRQP